MLHVVFSLDYTGIIITLTLLICLRYLIRLVVIRMSFKVIIIKYQVNVEGFEIVVYNCSQSNDYLIIPPNLVIIVFCNNDTF